MMTATRQHRFVLLAAAFAAAVGPRPAATGQGAAPAGAPGANVVEAWEVLETAPAPGGRCIVCGGPMAGGGDVLILYKGRTVAVCARCPEAWAADPEGSFRTVQARSALFDEESVSPRRVGPGWLFLGAYVLAGTLVGGLCAYVAVSRGLPSLPWFFAGVLANVVALALVLTRRGDTSRLPEGVPRGLRKVPSTYAPRNCARCGAEHHPSAARCPGCGAELQPAVEAEVRRV